MTMMLNVIFVMHLICISVLDYCY